MTTSTQNLSAAVQSDMVSRLKRDDQEVLRDILQSFGSLVIRNLRTVLPGLTETDVEDVLAEALFRLWRCRASYAPEKGSLVNWFLHIARNTAIDTLKPGWRQARALERPFTAESCQVPDKRATPELPVPELPPSLAQSDLMDIVAELDETDRSIIHAYACSRNEGSWTGPLVDELGMSAGAIRTRAHRLMLRLRREMQGRGYELGDLATEVRDPKC